MNPDVQWSTREKLAIASYVFHNGDPHWNGSVSRLLRPLGDPDRPSDWFSPKNCAQQYTALVHSAENSRRKRTERSDSNESVSSTLQVPVPSISETVLRRVTQERVDELKKLIRNERTKYKKILQTLEQLESGQLSDKIDEMYGEMLRQSADEEVPISTESTSTPSCSQSKPEEKMEQSIPEHKSEIPISVEVPNLSKDKETLELSDHEDTAPILPDMTPTEEKVVQESAGDGKDVLSVTTKSIPQVPVTEKEEPSPTTSSSRTLPTPTPVIESDSGDDGEEEENIQQSSQEAATFQESASVDSSVFEEENPSPMEITATEQSETMQPTKPSDEKLETIVPPPQTGEPVANIQAVVTQSESIVQSETTEKDDSEVTNCEVKSDSNNSLSLETPEINPTKTSEKLQANNIASQVAEEILQTKEEIFLSSGSATEESDSQKLSSIETENTESELFDFGSNVSSAPALIESFPSSPALSNASDIDPEATAQSKAWKRSIMILWKQVASHRYASLFLHPVTNEIAPNYSSIVLRPMDLSTLKKNVENGLVRTTSEFQRDLMLMFQNALMYNNCEHDVYKMTQEMQKDVMDQVEQFLATQLMMETTKQQSATKGLRRSTLRKSIVTTEKGSKRVEESKLSKKKND